MMLAIYHLLTGCSLIEISEISKLAKLGNISDVAFMKRFKHCNNWFKWIIDKTVSEGLIKYKLPQNIEQYRILAVDASDVIEKGRSGRIYRLHFALDVFKMHAALYSITSNTIGEHLRNFDFSENDLVLADRAYSNITGIEYCYEKKAQFILRMRLNSFKPYNSDGEELNLMERIKGTERGSINAFARNSDRKLVPVRICYLRKNEDSIKATYKKLRRKESKKQFKITDKAKIFNEYFVAVTSLSDEISAEEVLNLYRYRWQVELYFKRLKSILNYGEMPKKTEESIFSWLNGKLMVALLVEKMISEASFPPKHESFEEYLERDEDDFSSAAE